jgi:hypothetical protein
MSGLPQTRKTSPDSLDVNKQYDLFTTFFGKDKRDLSNTIELWDAIPKYAVSPRQQNARRDDNGRLPVHVQEFEYRPSHGEPVTVTCRLKVQPASIEVNPGQFVDFYPSTDEELIEEVLKKIFSDQQYGMHSAEAHESWVRFTLYMIRKELKNREKTRSLDEIKRSLEIMSRAVYEIEFQGQSKGLKYTNPILNDLTRITRDDYKQDPNAMWTARLPALVSKSINDVTYRQFNYATLMSLPTPLARWFHKRLSHRYTNAGILHPYHIRYSTIERDSGLLHHSRTSANRKAVDDALNELIQRNVLLNVSSDVQREGREVVEVLYVLHAHPDFVAEVKAANARQRDHRQSLGTGLKTGR